MLSKNVCTYYTYLYLYNPYLFKFLIYWDIVLILLHAYLTLAALLVYHSHWTACTVLSPPCSSVETTHVYHFLIPFKNFPLNAQCNQIISQFIKKKINFKNRNSSLYSRWINHVTCPSQYVVWGPLIVLCRFNHNIC